MLGYTSVLDGFVQRGSLDSETCLATLLFLAMVIFPPTIWNASWELALVFLIPMVCLNLYYIPKYHYFLMHEINNCSIDAEKFAALVPGEIHQEGVREPEITIQVEARKIAHRNDLGNENPIIYSSTSKLNVENSHIEADSRTLLNQWNSFKNLDVVEILISIIWADRSFKLLKSQQDKLWCELSRVEENANLFLLLSSLRLGTTEPLTVFKHRSRGKWGELETTFQLEAQTIGTDIIYYVKKQGMFDFNIWWFQFFSLIGGCLILGWYLLLKKWYYKKEIRQKYNLSLAIPNQKNNNRSYISNPNQIQIKSPTIEPMNIATPASANHPSHSSSSFQINNQSSPGQIRPQFVPNNHSYVNFSKNSQIPHQSSIIEPRVIPNGGPPCQPQFTSPLKNHSPYHQHKNTKISPLRQNSSSHHYQSSPSSMNNKHNNQLFDKKYSPNKKYVNKYSPNKIQPVESKPYNSSSSANNDFNQQRQHHHQQPGSPHHHQIFHQPPLEEDEVEGNGYRVTGFNKRKPEQSKQYQNPVQAFQSNSFQVLNFEYNNQQGEFAIEFPNEEESSDDRPIF